MAKFIVILYIDIMSGDGYRYVEICGYVQLWKIGGARGEWYMIAKEW